MCAHRLLALAARVMPRVTVEFHGALIHCTPSQVHCVLAQIGVNIPKDDVRSGVTDVPQHATMVSRHCLDLFVSGLGLKGVATRNFGTALRSAPVRQALDGVKLRDTSLLQTLQWIAAASDAQRHLVPTMIDEAYASVQQALSVHRRNLKEDQDMPDGEFSHYIDVSGLHNTIADAGGGKDTISNSAAISAGETGHVCPIASGLCGLSSTLVAAPVLRSSGLSSTLVYDGGGCDAISNNMAISPAARPPESTEGFFQRVAHDVVIDGPPCSCGVPSMALPSYGDTGRPFYKCARPHGEQCSFFQWFDEESDDEADEA